MHVATIAGLSFLLAYYFYRLKMVCGGGKKHRHPRNPRVFLVQREGKLQFWDVQPRPAADGRMEMRANLQTAMQSAPPDSLLLKNAL
jgi:hypothetical protein